MGYIQDKLIEALGGDKFIDNKNSIIQGWTPNNVKSLIIGKYYILVIRHIGMPKVINLNQEQVKLDLNKLRCNGGSPKLNNILKRRSFSCMEEFYVDSLFLENPPIIDIVGYITDLYSSTSRLRYFGYGEFSLGSDSLIIASYNSNSRNLDYSLAMNNVRNFKLEYRDLKNTFWYKNYYLRPQYYHLDNEKGKLALHFKKFEDDYERYIKVKKSFFDNKELEENIRLILNNDEAIISYLRKFDSFLGHLSRGNKDDVISLIFSVVKDCIYDNKCIISGLNNEILIKVLSDSNNKDYLIKSYNRFGVIDESSNSSLDKDKIKEYIKEGRGLIDFKDILDNICLNSIKVLLSKGYKNLVGISLVSCEKDIPEGKFRNTYIKRSTSSSSLDGYFSLLGELIGVTL